MASNTRDPRVRVVNYGPRNWRTEAQDADGSWSITGPPYASKTEALLMVDQVAAYYF
jgi:hypothetical protein